MQETPLKSVDETYIHGIKKIINHFFLASESMDDNEITALLKELQQVNIKKTYNSQNTAEPYPVEILLMVLDDYFHEILLYDYAKVTKEVFKENILQHVKEKQDDFSSLFQRDALFNEFVSSEYIFLEKIQEIYKLNQNNKHTNQNMQLIAQVMDVLSGTAKSLKTESLSFLGNLQNTLKYFSHKNKLIALSKSMEKNGEKYLVFMKEYFFQFYLISVIYNELLSDEKINKNDKLYENMFGTCCDIMMVDNEYDENKLKIPLRNQIVIKENAVLYRFAKGKDFKEIALNKKKYQKIKKLIGEFKARTATPEITKKIDNIISKNTKTQSLSKDDNMSLLIEPIQRGPRWKLFFDDIQNKYPEMTIKMSEALEKKFSDIEDKHTSVHFCNGELDQKTLQEFQKENKPLLYYEKNKLMLMRANLSDKNEIQWIFEELQDTKEKIEEYGNLLKNITEKNIYNHKIIEIKRDDNKSIIDVAFLKHMTYSMENIKSFLMSSSTSGLSNKKENAPVVCSIDIKSLEISSQPECLKFPAFFPVIEWFAAHDNEENQYDDYILFIRVMNEINTKRIENKWIPLDLANIKKDKSLPLTYKECEIFLDKNLIDTVILGEHDLWPSCMDIIKNAVKEYSSSSELTEGECWSNVFNKVNQEKMQELEEANKKLEQENQILKKENETLENKVIDTIEQTNKKISSMENEYKEKEKTTLEEIHKLKSDLQLLSEENKKLKSQVEEPKNTITKNINSEAMPNNNNTDTNQQQVDNSYHSCIALLEHIASATQGNKKTYLKGRIDEIQQNQNPAEAFKKFIVAVFQKRTGLGSFFKETTTGKQWLQLLQTNETLQNAFKNAYPASNKINFTNLQYHACASVVNEGAARDYIKSLNESKVSNKKIEADKNSFSLYRICKQ